VLSRPPGSLPQVRDLTASPAQMGDSICSRQMTLSPRGNRWTLPDFSSSTPRSFQPEWRLGFVIAFPSPRASLLWHNCGNMKAQFVC